VAASVGFGIISAVGGFIFSYYLNLPTGACTVLVSTLLFAAAVAYRTLAGRAD
jgi:ABC-type Mn2+/Zn2+ transport system permease subunit